MKTIEEIEKSIRDKQTQPIYLLMGAEAYYIDKLCERFENGILEEDEKDMDLTILYGKDIKADNIINQARRYPVAAKHNVVIVKELQAMDDDVDKLIAYARNPAPATILVLCYKNGKIDKRKKIADEITKTGCVFISDKLKEYAIPGFVLQYAGEHAIKIDEQAAQMLSEYVGNDLSRLANEIDKLAILANGTPINRQTVASSIGMSKEHNIFELRDALAAKDIAKANIIAKHIEQNTKNFPLQAVLPMIFNYFANLMLAHYAPGKEPRQIAAFLNLKSEWQAKEYIKGMKNYSARKTMAIIEKIKETDAASKGAIPASQQHPLRELVFFILH